MVAAAVIGSAVIGAVVSSDASDKASSTQEGAANRAANETQRQFEVNRADQAPWREAGAGALAQQTAGLVPGGDFNRDFTLADFNKDPGYQFRMDEGMRGIEGSAAARGGLLSGGTLKALNQYNQNFASNEYGSAYQRFNADRDRRFNRLSSVAGTGQTATSETGAMGIAATESMNRSRMMSADASAAGTMGQANAINGGISNGVNGYMSMNMMNRMYPQSGTTAAAPATSYGPATTYSGSPAFTPIA